MIDINKRFKKIVLICVFIFIFVMNISGHVLWLKIVGSKELLLFFTVTTLISQSVLLILINSDILLKLGFYYWLFVLIMNVAMTVYLYFGTVGIVRSLSKIFLFIRARTFWLFSTSELLYLPGFDVQGGPISKENLFSLSVFLIFIALYRFKIKKLPR